MKHIFESTGVLDRRHDFMVCLILLVLFGALMTLGLSGCDQVIPPLIPNEIVETIPAHGEIDVSIDEVIEITFTKSVNQDSLNVWATPAIDYEASWSTDNTTAILTLSENMLEGTTYLVTVEEASFDDGSLLSQPVSFIFTTVGRADSTVPLAQSKDNEDAVAAAVDEIDRLLLQGKNLEVILSEVVARLEADPRVEFAGTDPESNTIWVEFVDGEIQLFEVIDDTVSNPYPLLEEGAITPAAKIFPSIKDVAEEPSNGGKVQQTDTEYSFRMPASRKALLANSFKLFHKNWIATDSTNFVQNMLKSRGYEVDRKNLTVDTFNNLDKYGVILLEAHGVWRPFDTITRLVCPGSQQVILTTTPITTNNPPPDWRTNVCSQLVSFTTKRMHRINTTIGNKERSLVTNRFYGVTADYVKARVNSFPDNSVFFLSACRGIGKDQDGDTYSPFRDVFFDKSEGGVFLGWDNRVHSWSSHSAILNFFQYATASNDSVTVNYLDKKSRKEKTKIFLKSFDVPWGGTGMTVQGAFYGLQQKVYTYCERTGSTLILESEKDPFSNLSIQNILMPHPLDIGFITDCKTALISLYAGKTPQVTVDGVAAPVTQMSGAMGPLYGSAWYIALPTGVSGELIVTEDGRTSIPRMVYLCEPQINIRGSGDYGMQFSIDLKLHIQATVDYSSFRSLPWDEVPRAGFMAYADCQESTYSWQVSGSETIGNTTCVNSGSGNQSLENAICWFFCQDGKTAELSVYLPIEFTTTCTDPESTESFVNYGGGGFLRQNVPVLSDWTIDAQSFTDSVYGCQVSWNKFSPVPIFSNDVEPR